MAERGWSSKEATSVDDFRRRLHALTCELQARGLPAEPASPPPPHLVCVLSWEAGCNPNPLPLMCVPLREMGCTQPSAAVDSAGFWLPRHVRVLRCRTRECGSEGYEMYPSNGNNPTLGWFATI